MGSKIRKFADASREKISSMEHQLSGVLQPIKPSKEFVHGIARRIQKTPQTAFVDRIANWRLIAMLIAGLVSMAVFLALLGRVLLSFLGKKRTA